MRVRASLIALAAVAWSCSNPAGLDRATADVGSVSVDPPTSTLIIGGSAPLKAVVQDMSGRLLPDAAVLWTVKDQQVATVSSSGVVTAVALGSTQIAASSGGHSGLATITVQRPPVASVVVLPAQAEALAGARTQLSAVAYDAANAALTDRAIVWSSSNENVATVDATGLVIAVAAGTATISATSEGKTGTSALTVGEGPVASVTVVPPTLAMVVGQSAPLAVTMRNAAGVPVSGRTVVWSSSNTGVATVSAAGVVGAAGAGAATITATSEGVAGSSAVTVTPPSVASVIVSPSTKSLVVGQTAVLSATVKDATGTTLTDRPVAWSTSDPAIAAVSQAGVVTAIAPGTVTITATSQGKSGAGAVTVTAPPPVPVGSVVVTPATKNLLVGETVTLTATTKDASGATLTGRTVVWSTSSSTVASVSSSGVVTALAPGSATITATSEGKSGTSVMTVSAPPPPVASVTVLPTAATLNVGTTTGLSATLKDASGAVLTNRTIVWSTSNAGVASVSQSGIVTAVAAGTAVITGTSEGKSGSATITVVPAPVASVALQPATLTVTAGQTAQITATLKDALGNVLTGRVITWTSSLDAIATVSSAGLVTATSPGSTTITATSEGKSATAIVTVVAGPAATVIVTPAPVSIQVGKSLQLTATAYDANGNWITGRPFTWTSSNTNIATVSSSGLVTARRTGSVTITASIDAKSGGSAVTVTP